MPDSDRQDRDAADVILESYGRYADRFRYLTLLARGNFDRRDWREVQRTSGLRLDIYSGFVAEGLAALRGRFGERIEDRVLWARIRGAYAGQVHARGDAELAETFFNSIVRRVFHTVGVDPTVEFVAPTTPRPAHEPPWSVTARHDRDGTTETLVRSLLTSFRFETPWEDLDGDARRIAGILSDEIGGDRVRGCEVVRAPFFRGKGAYVVGVVHADGGARPLVIAITNSDRRLAVDAVLLTEDEASIVFSFARAYFFVDLPRPRELVDFLRTIMPRKPVAELYNAIGLDRHGKTELYRAMLHHLETSDDRFEIAPGQRGMVMTVFTLPGFDVVFKVIRDRFEYPKTASHEEVRAKYRMVFRHDRAGRLVDAQEFEHLEFERRRFSEELLEQLLALAGETVEVRGERVVVRHLYTERRLVPLDVHLQRAGPVEAREAVLDYGQALRDLARTNIFPGDMLYKNFGVSRHGRLIFYDYDELCRLDECNFRVLPRPRDADEETAGEPWFFVGERDIFPEEFRAFLGLKGELLDAFLAVHGELLNVAYWRRMQELHRRGEVLDVYPYKSARRLRLRSRAREAPGTGGSRRQGAES